MLNSKHIKPFPISKKEAYQPTPILKPQEFQALLTHSTPKVLPAIVLGGFCGLRSVEILGLDWSAINLNEKIVLVVSGSESRQNRLVPLPEAAVAWLIPIAQNSGRIIQFNSRSTFFANSQRLWKAAGVERIPNALRLSAASYLFTLSRDTIKTAKELGNFASMLLEHFVRPQTKEDADRWFSTFPHPRS